MHRFAVAENGASATRCGIHLSEADTDLTIYGSPIRTTFFDERTTCQDCVKGSQRAQLSVIK